MIAAVACKNYEGGCSTARGVLKDREHVHAGGTYLVTLSPTWERVITECRCASDAYPARACHLAISAKTYRRLVMTPYQVGKVMGLFVPLPDGTLIVFVSFSDSEGKRFMSQRALYFSETAHSKQFIEDSYPTSSGYA